MKTKIVLLSLSLLTLSHSMPDWGSDEIGVKIEETLGRYAPDDVDLSWLTPELRPIVHERLLRLLREYRAKSAENLSKPGSHNFYHEIEDIEGRLISSSHAETIQELVNRMMKQGWGLTMFKYCANEETLPFLLHPMTHGSSIAPVFEGPTLPPSIRYTAVSSFLQAIIACEKFPPITRQWADQMSRQLNYKDDQWIALISSWYKNNEAAILEKRYEDATWVPRYKGKPTAITEEEARLREEHFGKKRANRRTIATENLIPSELETTSYPPVWLRWTLGAVSIAALVFFYRRFLVKVV